MPNGQGQRWENEKEDVIRPIENDGWELLTGDDRPDWVKSAVPESLRKHLAGNSGYKYEHYHGDTFVYKAASSVHGNNVHIFRKLKSEYHETTPQEGTCPNCQSYIERYDDDDYLTCHQCGWQYKPIKERLKNLI
ncbi:hypothetical protein ACM16X_14560 [Haloarcula japonica]|uniref:hypothetical protein n=1 Tax=Haloarcula japonica TaxID=29282 RepID=UPI0039F6EAFF